MTYRLSILIHKALGCSVFWSKVVVLLVAMMGFGPLVSTGFGYTYVGGSITYDTTWTVAESPYWASVDVVVEVGVTLTIDPGVEILFCGTGLVVKGDLYASGTPSENILFTSDCQNRVAGDWQGISFSKAGSGDLIEYAVIQHAQYGVYCRDDSTPQILNCRITNNTYGIYNYYYGPGNGRPKPVVNSCEIFFNVVANYYNETRRYDWSSAILNARYNYWGAESGQAIEDTIWDREDDRKEAQVDIDGFGFAFSPNGDGNKDSFAFNRDLRTLMGLGENLLTNPGAETGDISGWETSTGFGVRNEKPSPYHGSWQFYAGERATAELHQVVDLTLYYTDQELDSGEFEATVGGYQRSFEQTPVDEGMIRVDFLDGLDQVIHTVSGESVGETAKWVLTELRELIPAGTRKIRHNFIATRSAIGAKNNASLDWAFVYVYKATVGENLLTNPGAETGDISGWETSTGFGVRNEKPSPYHGSWQFYAGERATAELHQVVDLTLYYTDQELDSGEFEATVGGYQRSFEQTPVDEGMIRVDFLDGLDQVIHTVSGESVGETAKWVLTELRELIPAGTRKIRHNFIATRSAIGAKNNASLDSAFVYVYKAPVWTVVILDAYDQIVRTLQSIGIIPHLDWDGKDEFGQPAEDGTYTWEILAVQDDVQKFYTTGEVLLDTAPLLVTQISSPENGQEVFNVVQIFGDIQDTQEIYHFSIEFGEGASPTAWTEFRSGSSLPPSGFLGSWDTKPVVNTITYPNGLYTIRLIATDFAGNMLEDTVQVNVANLYITDVSRTPSTIDISQGETADINFTISLPAEVTLKIYPEWEGTNGQLVKSITQTYAAAGSYSISWDGTDNSSSFVPDEAYIYVLEAVDPGNPSRTDTYSPTGGHDNGSAIGSVDGYYNVYRNDFWNMVFHNASASRVSMQVIPASSDSFYVFDDVPYEAGDWLIMWDGRDPQGNIITGSVNIDSGIPPKLRPNYIITKGFDPDVGGAAGNIGIKSDPYIATICYGQFFKLLYNINADCQVTIKILPPGINSPDAPQAIEIVLDELQTAGDHEVTWYGLDPLDPNDKKMLINEDGFYTFTIEAANPQTGGTTLKRGIINLYQ